MDSGILIAFINHDLLRRVEARALNRCVINQSPLPVASKARTLSGCRFYNQPKYCLPSISRQPDASLHQKANGNVFACNKNWLSYAYPL